LVVGRSVAVVKVTVTADTVAGSFSATVMDTAEICPPNGPEAIFVLSKSNMETTEISTLSPVLVPDAMFEKVQVFAAVSHALVVESTKLLALMAALAAGVPVPPEQATTGAPVPATKNPDGKLMVIAFAVFAEYCVPRVKTTVTALPAGAAAAAVPGTL
jgi:hypothetical protein